MKPKRLIFIVVGLVVLVVIGTLVSGPLTQLVQGQAAPVVTPDVPVEMAVRARGEVTPAQWADLAFERSGRLVEWLVAEGEVVEAGAPLARLDTAQAERVIAQAQTDLAAAQNRLARAEVDQAYQLREAELAQQQAEARQAQTRARYPGLTGAAIDVQRAEKALIDANEAYRRAAETPGMFDVPGVRDHYQEKIDLAEQDLALAQASYGRARGEQAATTQEIAVLEGEVERATLALEKLQRGLDPSLAYDVARAEMTLEQALVDLEALTLVAPFDGTVVKQHLKIESWSQPGAPAVTLADLTTLEIHTTDLDEWGMTHIAVGAPVDITLTAFDDKVLSGYVRDIALRGDALPGGDVAYRAVIALDKMDSTLRWGMTVRIAIPIEE
ncbi:MAG: HlyD family efflux transporter periplasmic adaptor subunit [Anaerolineae bacterium]|nr:HlyD family efflux transporter periplasmic adaptor subunit [Anaerolineae bacterium]